MTTKILAVAFLALTLSACESSSENANSGNDTRSGDARDGIAGGHSGFESGGCGKTQGRRQSEGQS